MYFIDIYNDGRIAVIKELNKKVLYSTYIDNVKVKGAIIMFQIQYTFLFDRNFMALAFVLVKDAELIVYLI